MCENFLESNRYFALSRTTTRLANRTMPSLHYGFLWRKIEDAMFCSFHLLADKTNNEHLPKPFFECECDVRCSFCHYGPQVMKLLRLVSLT